MTLATENVSIMAALFSQSYVLFVYVLFQCNDTTINTSMTSGIAIETGLVLLLSLLPIVEKSIGRMTNLGEDNAVLIFQSIIVAYIVKTCEYT